MAEIVLMTADHVKQEIRDLFARFGSGDYMPTPDEVDTINQGLDGLIDPLFAAEPIGFAVRMAEGPFVGIWQDRELAEHVCKKQPPSHGNEVVPVYASPAAAPTEAPCRVGEAVGLLMSAAALMGGSHGSQQFENQCGHLAGQINAFVGTIHPLECGPLATCRRP